MSTVLKSNPFSIMWGPIPFTAEYKIGYEAVTGPKQSSQVMFSYLGKSPIFSLLESDLANQQGQDIKLLFQGFRFQGSHRFFAHGLEEALHLGTHEYAPEGLYISPHISYSTVRISNKYLNSYDIYIRGSHFNINLNVGYQLFISDRLCVEGFAGLGYKRNWWQERFSSSVVQGIDTQEFGALYNNPVRFSIGYTFGYAF